MGDGTITDENIDRVVGHADPTAFGPNGRTEAEWRAGAPVDRGLIGNKPDNWVHRSAGMKCSTCMWYAPKLSTVSPDGEVGRCRRHSPTMNGFPVMFATDWCGDHKLDEEKLDE